MRTFCKIFLIIVTFLIAIWGRAAISVAQASDGSSLPIQEELESLADKFDVASLLILNRRLSESSSSVEEIAAFKGISEHLNSKYKSEIDAALVDTQDAVPLAKLIAVEIQKRRLFNSLFLAVQDMLRRHHDRKTEIFDCIELPRIQCSRSAPRKMTQALADKEQLNEYIISFSEIFPDLEIKNDLNRLRRGVEAKLDLELFVIAVMDSVNSLDGSQ